MASNDNGGDAPSLLPRVAPSRLALPPFRPHLWLGGGHRQTLAAAFGPRAPAPYQAQTFLLDVGEQEEAGDQIVVHDDCPANWHDGSSLAILLHGLGGCHLSSYVTRLQHRLCERGVRVWRVDQRGFGHSVNCRGLGHAGRFEDVQRAVELAAVQYPRSPISLFGFSMGGNITLSALGRWGRSVPSTVVCAAAVAPPLDLLPCALKLKSGAQRWYGKRFVNRLMKSLRQRQQAGLLPRSGGDMDLSRWPQDLMHLDDIYTAPLSGFGSAELYYAFASSKPWLRDIHVPTLILAADDDPIVPSAIYREGDGLLETTMVQTHLLPQGGHVGYFSRGGDDPDRCWLDWRLLDWFDHVHGAPGASNPASSGA